MHGRVGIRVHIPNLMQLQWFSQRVYVYWLKYVHMQCKSYFHCLCTVQVLSPEVAALELKNVLECSKAQNQLKTFFELLDTSPELVTYTSGTYVQYGSGVVYRGGVCGEGLWSAVCGEGALECGVKKSLLAVLT